MIKTKSLIFQDFIQYPDIEIIEGNVNFIVGESGSGKSTLLKLLNKTATFSSGDILYNGHSIDTYESIALRKEMRLISQTPFLFRGSIRHNFELFYKYCNETLLNEYEMSFYLSITEANWNLDTSCDTLSGGEKQRVYLAICISMNWKVLLLDEPTSALDRDLSTKVLQNIIEYTKREHGTLVIISHDPVLVDQFSEHTIRLNGGITHE